MPSAAAMSLTWPSWLGRATPVRWGWTTFGYSFAVVAGRQEKTVRADDGQVDQFIHGRQVALFGPKPTTLNLPVEESPSYFETNPAEWRRIEAASGTDIAVAMQEAIDSGATSLYVSRGRYRIGSPVVVRGDVRRIILFNSFYGHSGSRPNTATPLALPGPAV